MIRDVGKTVKIAKALLKDNSCSFTQGTITTNFNLLGKEERRHRFILSLFLLPQKQKTTLL